MDPSAHSLAFRGGAEVPDEEGCYISAACVSRVQGPTTRHSYVGSTAPNSPHTYYGRGAILYWRQPISWVGTYRALKRQGRLEAVQRAPNTQVHPASRAMECPALNEVGTAIRTRCNRWRASEHEAKCMWRPSRERWDRLGRGCSPQRLMYNRATVKGAESSSRGRSPR